MKNVNLTNSISYIGAWAFYNCYLLESIKIPNTIKCIKENTFYNCAKLTDVILPSKVEIIEDLAFCNCSSLSVMNVVRNVVVPETSSSAFRGANLSLAHLKTSDKNYNLFLEAPIWEEFGTITKEQSLIGDLNKNGVLDKEDITIMANYLLSKNVNYSYIEDFDIDDSGSISISDLTILISLISSK